MLDPEDKLSRIFFINAYPSYQSSLEPIGTSSTIGILQESKRLELSFPSSIPYALCSMLYALCFMLYALCSMLYALCFMPYALCPMLYALCFMPYALCPMLYALCL
ncbi:hypothetical protein EDC96DRAFT_550402 [Choanephora cucurbitarum]|nr:hypothetical protein EDC96DRAFT_550402 [Choanephora cucurbitarum]